MIPFKDSTLLKPQKREELFGNAPELLKVSKQLVSQLKHRLIDWTNVDSQRIADIFLSLVSFHHL
jgi:hypothetical protein